MRVKRYEAENMAEALRMIREDLGPNAFVLSTRRVQKRDRMGRLRRMIEVSAASDVVQTSASAPARAVSGGADRAIRELKAQLGEIRSQMASLHPGVQPAQIEELKQQLEEVKELVRLATDQWAKSSAERHGPILQGLFRRLQRADVDERLAAKLIGLASKELSSRPAVDEKEALKVLFDVMRRQTLVSGPIQLLESGPKTVILVGPTGVGKTTTLAKLAAQYSMVAKRRVGLLTIDTFRIGAVEQLRIYANILELPLKVASTPEQMRQSIREYQDMDLVLVDTGGRSQKDRAKMAELLNFVSKRDDMYYELHLLLGAATKNRDLIEITREFGKMVIDYLIFTKLDECNSFGGIFNEVVWTQKPISYLTTGQNVPDDIEVAESSRIVQLVLSNTFRKRSPTASAKGL